MFIVTIIDYQNFGNRLQNYALHQVLSKYSGHVVTLTGYNPWNPSSIWNCLRAILSKTYKYTVPTKRNLRFRNGMRFTRKYLHSTPFALDSLLRLFQGRVPIVVGSDQVWNPYFHHLSRMDTLSSLKGRQGISYAASFGVDELPEEYHERLKDIGAHFKGVSVREESGKKILDPYVDNVQVHIDPTMLLTSEEWEEVMRRPDGFTDEKYITLYFLGDLSDKRRTEIEVFARQNGFQIVDLMDRSSTYYSFGPDQFLWVMRHTEAVFTDSFHGCVFSFLFDKPLMVYEREDDMKNMSSRMSSFMPKFHLENRFYSGRLLDDILEHDYSEGYQVLELERKRSEEYLDQYLAQ